MLSKTINHKHKNAIATKVAIQMNCKIGGAPWGLDIPSKEMMIMGLDVCNDGNNKNQIIGKQKKSFINIKILSIL